MTTTTTAPALSRETVLEAIKAAKDAPYTVDRASGCGRVYVTVGGDRKTINAVAAACKALGLIFQRKAYYGLRNAIYVGYDNADGRALARGKVFAETLRARGISAYDEACAD